MVNYNMTCNTFITAGIYTAIIKSITAVLMHNSATTVCGGQLLHIPCWVGPVLPITSSLAV